MAERERGLGWIVAIVIGVALTFGGPLIGVLYTIFGIRRSFSGSSAAPPSEKARVLAEGISESMNGSAFGIVVAICGVIVITVSVIGYIRATRAPRETDSR